MTVDTILLLIIPPLALAHTASWGVLLGNLAYLRRQRPAPPDFQL